MGVTAGAALPLITAQENAGRLQLPSQYTSLQGADLPCCFFTPSRAAIRRVVILEAKKNILKKNIIRHKSDKYISEFCVG